MSDDHSNSRAEKSSVWIIDDNDPYCYILSEVINKSSRLYCDKFFTSAKPALEALATSASHPDVILLDISMPGMSGLDAIRLIDQASPGVIILMLTSMDEEEGIRLALKRGARGYILKVSTDEDILRSVELSLAGEMPLDSKITHTLIQAYTGTVEKTGLYELSLREQDVLKLVTQGMKNSEVAKTLCISTYTVETHLRNIFNKLDVKNRLAMVMKALKEGLV